MGGGTVFFSFFSNQMGLSGSKITGMLSLTLEVSSNLANRGELLLRMSFLATFKFECFWYVNKLFALDFIKKWQKKGSRHDCQPLFDKLHSWY